MFTSCPSGHLFQIRDGGGKSKPHTLPKTKLGNGKISAGKHHKQFTGVISMKKEEAYALIKNGRVGEWNSYRKRHTDWIPDLSNLNLYNTPLIIDNIAFNLKKANLCGCKFGFNSSSNISSIGIGRSVHIRRTGGDDLLHKDGIYVLLEGAIINAETKFPQYFNSAKYGTIFVSDSDPRGNPIPPTVFISYAWVNGNVVLAIDQWLRRKNINTKLDRRDFFAGSRIRDEIMRTMEECDVALVFHSKHSKDKPWIQFEQEFAKDLEMNAKLEGRIPPRIIYVVLDGTPLPSISEKQRLAIMAKGKRFEHVCSEIYHHILQLPRTIKPIDLNKWTNYKF